MQQTSIKWATAGLIAAAFLIVAVGRASAQRSQFDVSLGPIFRGLGGPVSTDRVGGTVRLGLGVKPAGPIGVHFAASAIGMGGPGDTPTSVRVPSGRTNIDGFGALGANADVRYSSQSSLRGAFASIGIGATWFAPGGPDPQWHGIASGSIGYQHSIGGHRSLFLEGRYERVLGLDGSPQWLAPILLGVSWARD
jgi:hypothetical protein